MEERTCLPYHWLVDFNSDIVRKKYFYYYIFYFRFVFLKNLSRQRSLGHMHSLDAGNASHLQPITDLLELLGTV